LLPDNRVLIAGGGPAAAATTAELYDPSTGIFTPTGSMGAAHIRATLLNNGHVLMTGGVGNAELYDPATGGFTTADAYAVIPGNLVSANLLADGSVLVTGWDSGCDSECDANLTEVYDPSKDSFSVTGGSYKSISPIGRTATLLMDGRVLFAGGENSDSWFPYADLYDASTGTFARTGEMTKARDNHTATLMPDGTVLIAGGRLDYGPPCCVSSSAADVYDPATGGFRSIGNMTGARGYHTATLLKDGTVLIAGGIYVDTRSPSPRPPTFLASAENYTPAALAPAALLSLAQDGKGQGAIQHADTYQLVTSDNPAVAREAVVIYCTGLVDGSVIPPQVAIGGRMAEVLWFGNVPGYPGLNQINARVPDGVAAGPMVSVRINYIGRPSNEVTIGVR
jgi:hypothetical protein